MPPPVVYLDQNHWITLARARITPEKVKKTSGAAELAAAQSVWQMIPDDLLVTPLSMAHMVETARRGTMSSRADLADAMLDAYRGWHMAHPVNVRRFELWSEFKGYLALSADPRSVIFSRAPGTPFRSDDYTPYVCDDPDLSPTARRWVEQISWESSWANTLRTDTLTDTEVENSNALIDAWAVSHTDLAQYMRDNPYSGRDLSLVAAVRTVADIHLDISKAAKAAGLSAEDLSRYLELSVIVGFIARLLFVGRMTDVIHRRLRNAEKNGTETI